MPGHLIPRVGGRLSFPWLLPGFWRPREGMPPASVVKVPLSRIIHRKVGGARKPLLYGALREPVQNRVKCHQGFGSVRNPPFSPRFAPHALQFMNYPAYSGPMVSVVPLTSE